MTKISGFGPLIHKIGIVFKHNKHLFSHYEHRFKMCISKFDATKNISYSNFRLWISVFY